MGVSKNGLVYNGKSHENRWFGDTYISGTHQIWFQHSKNMFDHVWKHQARWHFVIGCLKHQETIHHAHSIGSILAKWHLHLHCPIWGFNRVSQHWNRQVLGKITRFMLVKHHSLRTQFGHCLLRTRTVQPFGDDYPYNSHHSSAFAVRSWSNLSRLQSYTVSPLYPHYIPSFGDVTIGGITIHHWFFRMNPGGPKQGTWTAAFPEFSLKIFLSITRKNSQPLLEE